MKHMIYRCWVCDIPPVLIVQNKETDDGFKQQIKEYRYTCPVCVHRHVYGFLSTIESAQDAWNRTIGSEYEQVFFTFYNHTMTYLAGALDTKTIFEMTPERCKHLAQIGRSFAVESVSEIHNMPRIKLVLADKIKVVSEYEGKQPDEDSDQKVKKESE